MDHDPVKAGCLRIHTSFVPFVQHFSFLDWLTKHVRKIDACAIILPRMVPSPDVM